jgi:hypothetical protein
MGDVKPLNYALASGIAYPAPQDGRGQIRQLLSEWRREDLNLYRKRPEGSLLLYQLSYTPKKGIFAGSNSKDSGGPCQPRQAEDIG